MCHYIDEFKKLLQEVGITGLLYIAMQAEALGFPMSTIRRGRMFDVRLSYVPRRNGASRIYTKIDVSRMLLRGN